MVTGYLLPALVKIMHAVEKMMLPVNLNFKRDKENDMQH